MHHLLLSLIFVVPCLAAADDDKKASDEGRRNNRAAEAHRTLFESTDRGRESAHFTEAVMRDLPATAPGTDVPRQGFIDRILFRQMAERGIPHAGLASDTEYIRRVYLDAIGLPPEPDAVRAFVAGDAPQKRVELIDSLIGTEAFAEQWAWFWGDLFRLASQVGPVKNSFQFWVKEWLQVDRPYDEVVHDLLTGVSKAHGTIPALAFLSRSHQAKSRIVMSNEDYGILNRLDSIDQFNVDTSRIFLGITTSCISCHDGEAHLEPVSSWLTKKTRADFYRHSAFFGKTRMITTWDDRSKNVVVDLIVDDLAKGYDTADDAPFFTLSENRFPRLEGKSYEPAFLLTGEKPKPGENERKALARMITSHPQFARATVNLIWGKLMTAAFVEPYNAFDLDRMDPNNPPEAPWTIQPTNPELLEALAADFRESGYSIHHLMKTIFRSSAYQLDSRYPAEWKDDYLPYYPRKFVRVLTGPELVDTITRVTGRPGEFQFSGTTVTRVKQLAAPSDLGARRGRGEGAEINALLLAFSQSNRMTPMPVGNKVSTLQAMLMMQSSVVSRRVAAEEDSRVDRLVNSDATNDELIVELYLATLARWPSAAESKVALKAVSRDRAAGASNLQWALLNSPEFLLNH